uniref:Uncharacterized protein n=1 Tax=Anguilla anguilla TaxID=7936 RepID=A0A0E9T230_ANGAN
MSTKHHRPVLSNHSRYVVGR